MNAPLSTHHLTPEIHEALGKVTLDDHSPLCGEWRRSHKDAAGAAGGFVVERGVQ